MPEWTDRHIPDLAGKVAVVTGANSGLGPQIALRLAQHGCRVVMACRDPNKSERTLARIRGQTPNSDVSLMPLDLADLESIQNFAKNYGNRYRSLSLLFNNAGVMNIPYRKTQDGFEVQFGTNYLGHFALTGRLMPFLLADESARIVTLSSFAAKMGRIDFENLNAEKGYRKTGGTYNQSKLACLMFAIELNRRFKASGSSCISFAAHPGYSATNLTLVAAEMEQSGFSRFLWSAINRLVGQPAANRALQALYARSSPDARGGDYYGPDGFLELRGSLKLTRTKARLRPKKWRKSSGQFQKA